MTTSLVVLVLIIAGAMLARLGERLLDWLIPKRLNFGIAATLATLAVHLARTPRERREALDALGNVLASDPDESDFSPLAAVTPVLTRCVFSQVRWILTLVRRGAAPDRRTSPTRETWDRFVRETLLDEWLAASRARTEWTTEVLEIAQGDLVFLFDAAPTLKRVGEGVADDRVVAVWGRSRPPEERRDRGRLARFLPNPSSWSRLKLDRGHFVAHAAGGGLDLNLFPQAGSLNRGRSAEGRAWRKMENHAVRHPGTPLFVRPIYTGPSWKPAALDYGLLVDDRLWRERFVNHI